MSRGGAGRGQGRKPRIIPPELVQAIRDDFTSRSNAERQKQALARLDRRLEARGVVWEEDGQPNPIHQVPLKYRTIVSEYGSVFPQKKIPDDLPEEVEYAIDVMRANKRARGERQHYSTPLPRLYRQRSSIIAAVARSWGVSPRAVRAILEAERGL